MDLRQRLLDWMRGGEGNFAETSLQVFAHQFQQNLPYQNYCLALGKSPENVTSWQDIPAVPTDVFKTPDIPLHSFPAEEITGHFLTSGTTREVKGKHPYRTLSLYEASALGTWREMHLPPLDHTFLFSQPPTTAPHSSLIRMFSMLAPHGTWLIDENGNLDLRKFRPTQPTAILGTSIALLKACDEIPPLTLPESSWILETGGSKGLEKSFTPTEVRQRLSTHFGIPESRILNEYGMTELFSQCYKWGHEETHKAPPWTAIRILDVHTGQRASHGTPGYLELIDLANLDTLSAIRTQDLAIAHSDREFTLLGRDPHAIPRGCSRTIQ